MSDAQEEESSGESCDPAGEAHKLSAAQSLKRMEEFPERKEQFIATVRKGKNRNVSA